MPSLHLHSLCLEISAHHARGVSYMYAVLSVTLPQNIFPQNSENTDF